MVSTQIKSSFNLEPGPRSRIIPVFLILVAWNEDICVCDLCYASDAHMRQKTRTLYFMMMVCRLIDATPLSELMLLIGPSGTSRSKISVQIQPLLHEQMNCEMSSAKWRTFFSVSLYWWPYHNVNLQLPNHVHSRDTFLSTYQLWISNCSLYTVLDEIKSMLVDKYLLGNPRSVTICPNISSVGFKYIRYGSRSSLLLQNSSICAKSSH